MTGECLMKSYERCTADAATTYIRMQRLWPKSQLPPAPPNAAGLAEAMNCLPPREQKSPRNGTNPQIDEIQIWVPSESSMALILFWSSLYLSGQPPATKINQFARSFPDPCNR